MDGQTDGHTDDQCETIIPRHYCVAVYKKQNLCKKKNGIKRLKFKDIYHNQK